MKKARGARRAGEEYLLCRGLYRRMSTGEPVGPWATEFAYPSRWVYSVLSAADYFRSARMLDGRPADPRMAEAIEQIRAARRPDGTWVQACRHVGRVWFEVDVPPGEPSRWLTFYATRVLEWWDAANTGPTTRPSLSAQRRTGTDQPLPRGHIQQGQ